MLKVIGKRGNYIGLKERVIGKYSGGRGWGGRGS